MAAMKLILDAAPKIKSNYAIIVNKIYQTELLQIAHKKRTKRTLTKGLPKKTKHISYCQFHLDLFENSNNAIVRLAHLIEFINNTPAVELDPANVAPITHNKFDKLQQKLAKRKLSVLK